MTTRESLHDFVEQLNEDEAEILWAKLARGPQAAGKVTRPNAGHGRWVEARQYPVLASVWDNDDDAIFDDL